MNYYKYPDPEKNMTKIRIRIGKPLQHLKTVYLLKLEEEEDEGEEGQGDQGSTVGPDSLLLLIRI